MAHLPAQKRVTDVTLLEYIAQSYDGNQAAFARSLKTETGTEVLPQQVTKWINAGCRVFEEEDGSFWLYHPTREL